MAIDPMTLMALISAGGSIIGGITDQIAANRQSQQLEELMGVAGDRAGSRARQIAASRGLTGGAGGAFEEQMRQQVLSQFAPQALQATQAQTTALPGALLGGAGNIANIMALQGLTNQGAQGAQGGQGQMDIEQLLQLIQAIQGGGGLGGR